MAIFYNYISGGGDALNTVLSSGVIHEGNSHLNYFFIEDGVYDPIYLKSAVISNGYTRIILSSVNGAENCIIDGGTAWENDEFGGTMLSAGTRCFDSFEIHNSFRLSCCGIRFKNGYGDQEGSAFLFYVATGKYIYNCIIENMYSSGSYGSIISSNSGNVYISDRSIVRNVRGKTIPLGIRSAYDNCLVENISATYLVNSSNNFINSIARNCKVNRLFNYGQNTYNNLFYNISTSQNELFNLQRRNVCNCTFVISPTSDITCFSSFNQSYSITIANNIFVTTNGKKITIGTTRSGYPLSICNNYAPNYIGGNEINCLCGNDPGFIDIDGENFHLSKNSQCISAGNYDFLLRDYDLNNNLYNKNPSIGCYQFLSKNLNTPNKVYPL